jgi:beta-galactosidase
VEIKDFSKGTTDVHYIFNNVKLKEGENTIVTKITKNGKVFEDKITWHYSSKNKQAKETSAPMKKTEEHVGL